MEELTALFRVCTHIKKDGIRCNSPALKGGNFCFHHIGGSLREHTRARSIYNGPKLDFLYPGTRQAIQNNLHVVAQAVNDGNLELATANFYNRIFSAGERNLRRFEMLYQKSAPDVELTDINDEFPNTDLEDAEQSAATSQGAIPTEESEAGIPVNRSSFRGREANEAEEPALPQCQSVPASQVVIPTEVSAANEAEEPALPQCQSAPASQVVIPTEVSAANEAEEPALPLSSNIADDGPLKPAFQPVFTASPSHPERSSPPEQSPYLPARSKMCPA